MIPKNITLKGFRVPEGYILRISRDEQEVVKYPGDVSGSQYSFQAIVSGKVPGWTLEKVDNPVRPIKTSPEMTNILQDIEKTGGRALFVGGAVRDSALGLEPKDIDIEVYGIDSDSLVDLLGNYGKVDVVGASFGVIKLTTETGDYDFSLPRRESKQGQGHRGFMVETDHTMTPEESATRRDFTFNALAMSPTGEVFDYFRGLPDLKDGILRHTSEKFSEDPLRVLRGFQLAGRYNLRIDPKTAKLASDLKNEYQTIAKERVWGEWEKWAMKSKKPSAGLQLLVETGWIDFYPELKSLMGVPQSQQWHPEGDVWVHTLHVVDEAVAIADRDGLVGQERLTLVLAALCHDLGKAGTTVESEGMWRAPGHERASMEPTVELLLRLGAPVDIIEPVKLLVGNHMAHLNESTPRAVRRLALRLHPTNIETLVKVIEADHSGRPPLPKELPEEARNLLVMSKQLSLGQDKPTPLVRGQHLLGMANQGLIPASYKRGGTHFGHTINILFEAQLDGLFDNEYEGQLYLQRLLSPQYKSAVIFTDSLTISQQDRLLRYAREHGLDVEQIWDKGEEFLRSIIE
jgi:tRNA nucleotidyltransferase (CCA-adding enzyme)